MQCIKSGKCSGLNSQNNFCSSVTDPMRIREALDGGADDYIMKPFDEEIILSKLEILNLV